MKSKLMFFWNGNGRKHSFDGMKNNFPFQQFHFFSSQRKRNESCWMACRADVIGLVLRLFHSFHCHSLIDFFNKLTPSINSFHYIHSLRYFSLFVELNEGLFVCWCWLLLAEPLAGQPAHNPPKNQSTKQPTSIQHQ